MSEPIPKHWVRVQDGMSGVYIERNVANPSDWQIPPSLMDVIHVPDWNLHYQTDAGLFTTDQQIQLLVTAHAWGISKGVEQGKVLARAEIRAALGIKEPS